jgi:predicted nucleic acid-binding protein
MGAAAGAEGFASETYYRRSLTRRRSSSCSSAVRAHSRWPTPWLPAMAPDLLDAEVLSGLAGIVRARRIDAAQGRQALGALVRAPITRLPAAALLLDAWAPRDGLSAYDALYVAPARALETTLVTADARLTRAADLGVSVTLVPASD